MSEYRFCPECDRDLIDGAEKTIAELEAEVERWQDESVELWEKNEALREALRRLYACFSIDPFPLPKEVQRIVGKALKESG